MDNLADREDGSTTTMKEFTMTESIISLLQRTLDLTDSNRDLKAELASQKKDEAELLSLSEVTDRLLSESRQLQVHLKELTRRAFAAHEDERKKLSLALQDEIVQTLAGIHIRLLTLNNEVSDKSKDFNKEIAMTRRMVKDSMATLTRFNREMPVQDEN